MRTDSMPKLRLLLVTVAVGALALSLRCGDVLRLVGDAAAKDAGPAMSRSAEPAAPAAAEAQKPAADAAPEKATGGKATGESAEQTAAKAPDPGRLIEVPFTQTELDLLQKLAARRDALDAREREIEIREGLVMAAEQTLAAKTKELEQLRQRIEVASADFRRGEDEKLTSLVKIYETMRPKDAARIFDELDMPVLMGVMKHMKESKSAMILASMDPARARLITAKLAERQTLPAAGISGAVVPAGAAGPIGGAGPTGG